jgi:hypothetical protein
MLVFAERVQQAVDNVDGTVPRGEIRDGDLAAADLDLGTRRAGDRRMREAGVPLMLGVLGNNDGVRAVLEKSGHNDRHVVLDTGRRPGHSAASTLISFTEMGGAIGAPEALEPFTVRMCMRNGLIPSCPQTGCPATGARSGNIEKASFSCTMLRLFVALWM